MNSFKVVYAKQVKMVLSPDFESVTLYVLDDKNTEYKHRFTSKSRFFKMFTEDKSALESRLIGAPFVFTDNNNLVDFRTNDYRGFVQSEDVLNQLGEVLGVNKINSEDKSRASRKKKSNFGFVLGSHEHEVEFNVSEDNSDNGDFKAILSFPFNPFDDKVGCSVGVERLICLNGMATSSSVFNFKIPMINNVEENFRVALKNLAPQIQNKLKEKIMSLQHEDASLLTVEDSHSLIRDRMDSSVQNEEQMILLATTADVTDIHKHCSDTYERSILEKEFHKELLPSHLTVFDVWNILTEVDSHTNETESSTSAKIQRRLNTLVFNSVTMGQRERTMNMDVNKSNAFRASHKQAFFGKKGSGF